MQKKAIFLSTSYLNLASSSTLAGSWAACKRLGISGVAFRGVLGVPCTGCQEKLQPQADFLQTAISVGNKSLIWASQTFRTPEYKMNRKPVFTQGITEQALWCFLPKRKRELERGWWQLHLLKVWRTSELLVLFWSAVLQNDLVLKK